MGLFIFHCGEYSSIISLPEYLISQTHSLMKKISAICVLLDLKMRLDNVSSG